MAIVDLRQLAIDRGDTTGPRLRPRRHLLTRYVLPAMLFCGFMSLVAWASRDIVFPPRPVKVVPVLATHAASQREGTPLFQAAGWIEPRPTPVRAAALAPGVVERLLVVEDQSVKAGEPLAELIKDDAGFEYERAIADRHLREAELDEANAALRAAVTRLDQPVHLEAALGVADAELAKVATQLTNLPYEILRAEAQLEFARKDHEGKQSAKGAVAGRAIDEARSQLDTTQAMVEELRDRDASLTNEKTALLSRRDALRTQLELLADEIKAKGEADARVKAAEARVEQARVAVAEAKLRLDRMTVRSPIDGRVFRLIGHPGSRIGSGMTQMAGHDGSTIVTLYRPDMLQVRVDVRFEDIPQVGLGQAVEINNAALEAPLAGTVLFVSSEADIQKNTLQVKVAITSPPPLFKPEMLVDVTFLAPQLPEEEIKPSSQQRIYVPRSLVRQGEAGPFVWLADQSAGVARRTAVEVGHEGAGGLVEVTQGLAITSRLIAAGAEGLGDGERIRITGEMAPSAAANSQPSGGDE